MTNIVKIETFEAADLEVADTELLAGSGYQGFIESKVQQYHDWKERLIKSKLTEVRPGWKHWTKNELARRCKVIYDMRTEVETYTVDGDLLCAIERYPHIITKYAGVQEPVI